MSLLRVALFNFLMLRSVHLDNYPVLKTDELFTVDPWVLYVLGWLFFGNIADNIFDPKAWLVTCSITMGTLSIMLASCLLLYDDRVTERFESYVSISHAFMNFIYAGLEAFTVVQLFNWIPLKFMGMTIAGIQTIATLCFASQYIGEW